MSLGLDGSAFHLLRALAGGEVGNEVGIICLAELDPSGRTGGYHRQNAAVLYALNKFVGFLHDGEVGAEVGVEYLIEAQSAERRSHLALNVGAYRHAEALAEGNSDGRSGVNNNVLLGIRNSREYIVDLILLGESAGRTCDDTLSAGNAGNVGELLLIDKLLAAGCHAATAEYALLVVSHKMRGGIVDLGRSHSSVILVLVHAVLIAELLKLAVAASDAGETLLVVIGENEFQRCLSAVADSGSIGKYLHALVYGINACRDKRTRTLDFYNADTAGADLIDFSEIAKCGNFNSGVACCIENC